MSCCHFCSHQSGTDRPLMVRTGCRFSLRVMRSSALSSVKLRLYIPEYTSAVLRTATCFWCILTKVSSSTPILRSNRRILSKRKKLWKKRRMKLRSSSYTLISRCCSEMVLSFPLMVSCRSITSLRMSAFSFSQRNFWFSISLSNSPIRFSALSSSVLPKSE